MDDPIVQTILTAPALRREDNDALARIVAAGGADAERAVDRMVTGNMRLVYRIARKYPDGSLNLQDRLQEGALGLMRAARKFDPDRGVGFATYAAYWIRATIGRSISGSDHVLTVPDNVLAAIRRLRRASSNRRDPLTPDEVDRILVMGNRTPDVLTAMSAASVPLDAPAFPDADSDETRMVEVIADDYGTDPAETAILRDVWETVRRCEGLSERERKILYLYAGGETYAAIGVRYGLTRERIRQIVLKVVDTLRRTLDGGDEGRTG